jgi:hypothetical protein
MFRHLAEQFRKLSHFCACLDGGDCRLCK